MPVASSGSKWAHVDMETRRNVTIPDGYELRAVSLEDFGWTATFRRKIDGGYDMDDEVTYRVSEAGTFRVREA